MHGLQAGTWLFSEPQIHTDTLIDLETLGWQAIASGQDGIELAATCKIAELYAFRPSPEWKAGSLIGECCRAFLSSFKIWNEATIGGNIVMSLPAGPMISLTVALEGTYTLFPRDGRRARSAPPTSSPETTRTCYDRANCCAASTFRQRP